MHSHTDPRDHGQVRVVLDRSSALQLGQVNVLCAQVALSACNNTCALCTTFAFTHAAKLAGQMLKARNPLHHKVN